MFSNRVTMRTLLFAISGITLLVGISDINNGDPVAMSIPEPVSDGDYYWNGKAPSAQVELGRMLFFDRVISGNKNISCATCHHPAFATTDQVALPLGEGPSGLGPDRLAGYSSDEAIHERVPRNSPALFNLGATEFTRMFHDGRVEVDSFGYYDGGFITPAKWKLPAGLESVLAAQAMFPVGSPVEMAGQRGENSLAEAQALNNLAGSNGLWAQVAERLQEIPEYVDMFREAFPDEVDAAEDITMVLAANAIAAFESSAFRADSSAFDQFLRTGSGLNEQEFRGLKLFYGKANCASCHSGKFQTDHKFYSIAMPQIGPGKADGRDDSYWRETGMRAFLEDFGRGRVTYRPEDAYKFRTPSLRNVELTAPYGHDGAYADLEEVVRHHLDPLRALETYELTESALQPINAVYEITADGPELIHHEMSDSRREEFLKRDQWVMANDKLRGKIASANELTSIDLNDHEVDDLIAFLRSLTDPRSRNLLHVIPETVPSGLEVEQ